MKRMDRLDSVATLLVGRWRGFGFNRSGRRSNVQEFVAGNLAFIKVISYVVMPNLEPRPSCPRLFSML